MLAQDQAYYLLVFGNCCLIYSNIHRLSLSHFNHCIYLFLLVQVVLSGSLEVHTPLKCQYKQLLMCPLLGYNLSCGVWEQHTELESTLRCFIWLLIRTIPLYLRDRNQSVRLQRQSLHKVKDIQSDVTWLFKVTV